MTRQEIETELKALYEASARCTTEEAITSYENRISYLECIIGGLMD